MADRDLRDALEATQRELREARRELAASVQEAAALRARVVELEQVAHRSRLRALPGEGPSADALKAGQLEPPFTLTPDVPWSWRLALSSAGTLFVAGLVLMGLFDTRLSVRHVSWGVLASLALTAVATLKARWAVRDTVYRVLEDRLEFSVGGFMPSTWHIPYTEVAGVQAGVDPLTGRHWLRLFRGAQALVFWDIPEAVAFARWLNARVQGRDVSGA
jgi:membrane protein YdbS with pleckstrin-like domain